MTTQIILASTLYQVMSLSAMIRASTLGGGGDRRVLVVANNAYAPELVPSATQLPGFDAVAHHFDQVVDLNATVWPIHPKKWNAGNNESPMLERLLRREWGIAPGAPVELVLESLPGSPAAGLANVFADAPVSVHSDGLMSYGPSRNALPRPVFQRLTAIHYLDLVPGLQPIQLSQYAPRHVKQPLDSLREVMREALDGVRPLLSAQGWDERREDSAVLLGQYLAALGLITPEEETQLHVDMIDDAVDRGYTSLIFKPHPTSGPRATSAMAEHARHRGAVLEVVDLPVSAEVLLEQLRPGLAVSCFSTSLATARYAYGTEVSAVGTELLLERVAPYQNSNRIPITLVDALAVRGMQPPADAAPDTAVGQDVQTLVEAVSYCMQPQSVTHLRPSAEAYLSAALGTGEMRYFKRRRLTALGLPGASPAPRPRPSVRRRARRAVRRMVGPAVAARIVSARRWTARRLTQGAERG